jgi:hypothetical protein
MVNYAMGASFMQNKRVKTIAVLMALSLVSVWVTRARHKSTHRQAYEGTIIDVVEKRGWLGGFLDPETTSRGRYKYYWEVRCADGTTLVVEVPPGLYDEAKPGDRVRKAAKQSYPHLDTPEANAEREARDQTILDAVEAAEKRLASR